ncbi:hypothetical protein IAR55_006412 [Kwoniella newhampshirensis]|uniref:Glycogenin glucosyltransferase n=1 Tax=Kwoniella newhampshirensis TaxID=1651941 RepID=A0AAW0YTR1_9TREE
MTSLPNAFVTLLTTSSYLPGALVLLHSLHELHPVPRDFKIVCLVTPETVDARTIGELREAGYDLVIGVEPIGSGRAGQQGLNLMGRPDLNFALTKLHLFRLQPYFSTLIYLDADVLPLRPLSHLFTTTQPHVLSACPDTGWPDCFNSGVMVIRPRDSDWDGLRGLLKDGEGDDGIYTEASPGNGSFDGADQGLLNEWFSEEGGGGDWNRLPFTYNVTPSAAYTWAPAYKRYGHKISNVHFIGPNKPWANVAGRPAGVSQVKGKEPSYDYPSLIDRWYTVYDKYVRPSAAQDPDFHRRFAVPETVAVWNRTSATAGVPQQPEDRLNLSELKEAAARGVTSFKQGQYTSLPLEGRVDLLMPKPQPKPASIALPPSPPRSPVQQSSHHNYHQQGDPNATWDASRYSPPSHGKPEMAIPMNAVYHNAWEQPSQQQGSYFSSASHAEPQYPTLPDNVRHNDWYKQYAGRVPDRSNLTAVFPWEQRDRDRPAPGRIFPRGDTPPPDHRHPHQRAPPIHVRQPTPEGGAHGNQPLYSPQTQNPPRSMEEAMASYTNAWDAVPQIDKYIKRISGVGSAKAQRTSQARALQSVPGTPRGGEVFDFSRGKNEGSATDTSADGDDEQDSTEDESEDASLSPVVAQESTQNDAFSPYASNERYRDRFAQTDATGLVDAKVQAVPGGGPSPIVGTIPLPPHRAPVPPHVRRSSRVSSTASSSSETARQHSNLVTPPSDTSTLIGRTPGPTSATASQQPLPDYSFDLKGATQTHGHRVSGSTSSRVWDPSTDVDARKKDSQEVLNRFLKSGGFSGRS